MLNRYESYSYWLETAGEPLAPRLSLASSQDVDVAILGGGYSGLWTAYYLLTTQPSLKVAILEKEIVGYGGSGRNGGWCSPRFPLSASMLQKRYGKEAARKQLLAVQPAVDEIERVCDQEKIASGFRRGGTLTLARSEHQLKAIKAGHRAYEQIGLADHYQFLTPAQAEERIRVTNVHGALYTPDGASMHPGRLVRGLARAVEARGGTIYEQTTVEGFVGGERACLRTSAGEVLARKAVVLAGQAYLTRLPKLHRSLLPVYSLICLTEPLSAEQWKTVGWQQGENVASARSSVVYLTKTGDGRILFGSRGAPYAFGSKISDDQDRHAETQALIQQSLRDWFPALSGIRFTHSWGGPVAMPMDWMPAVSYDPSSRIAHIGGYTGQGVSTSNVAGRLLSGLISQTPTGLETLPMAQRESPKWIMEPLRWMVVRSMQHALQHADDVTEAGHPQPISGAIADFLGRH
jgi:glycine/D-amino acid oxidase-like deaminating enzyme